MASDSAGVVTAVPQQRYPAIRSALRAWWIWNGRCFPWRESGDPYAIFLAEMVLQKTQVTKAEKAYAELIAVYPDAVSLANAPHRHLERVFEWLGLVKRARYVQAAAKIIVEQHGGAVPHTADDLMALPGVGKYSTNAILCFAHSEAVPIVDTAIARVLKRLLGFSSEQPAWKDSIAWTVARDFLDVEHPVEHNYALLDLAALVCVPQKPQCWDCPVSAWCASASVRRVGAGSVSAVLHGADQRQQTEPRNVIGR